MEYFLTVGQERLALFGQMEGASRAVKELGTEIGLQAV